MCRLSPAVWLGMILMGVPMTVGTVFVWAVCLQLLASPQVHVAQDGSSETLSSSECAAAFDEALRLRVLSSSVNDHAEWSTAQVIAPDGAFGTYGMDDWIGRAHILRIARMKVFARVCDSPVVLSAADWASE